MSLSRAGSPGLLRSTHRLPRQTFSSSPSLGASLQLRHRRFQTFRPTEGSQGTCLRVERNDFREGRSRRGFTTTTTTPAAAAQQPGSGSSQGGGTSAGGGGGEHMKTAATWQLLKYSSPLLVGYWWWRRSVKKEAQEASRIQVSVFPREIRQTSRRADLETPLALEIHKSLKSLCPDGWGSPEEMGAAVQLHVRQRDQELRERRMAELRRLIAQKNEEAVQRSLEKQKLLMGEAGEEGSAPEDMELEVEVDLQQELWEEELEELSTEAEPILQNVRKFARRLMFWEFVSFCRALGSHETRSSRLAPPPEAPASDWLSQMTSRTARSPTAASFILHSTAIEDSSRNSRTGAPDIMPKDPLPARWRAPGHVPVTYMLTALGVLLQDTRIVPLSDKELEREIRRKRAQPPLSYKPGALRSLQDWLGITKPPELPQILMDSVPRTKEILAPEKKLRFAWYAADPHHLGKVSKQKLRLLIRDMISTGHFDCRTLFHQTSVLPPKFHVLDSEDITREILLHVREQRRQKLRRNPSVVSSSFSSSSSSSAAAAEKEEDETLAGEDAATATDVPKRLQNPYAEKAPTPAGIRKQRVDITDLDVNEISYREFKSALYGMTFGRRAQVWYLKRSDLGFWGTLKRHRLERLRNFLVRNGYDAYLDKLPEFKISG